MPQPSGRGGSGGGTLTIGTGGGSSGGIGAGGISWDIRTIKPEYAAAINHAVTYFRRADTRSVWRRCALNLERPYPFFVG